MKDEVKIAEFKEILNASRPSDFDGHTEFFLLSLEQKLLWLSQCAQFLNEVKCENKI